MYHESFNIYYVLFIMKIIALIIVIIVMVIGRIVVGHAHQDEVKERSKKTKRSGDIIFIIGLLGLAALMLFGDKMGL